MDRGVSACSVPAPLTKPGVNDVVFICINLHEETLGRLETNKRRNQADGKHSGNETLHRIPFLYFLNYMNILMTQILNNKSKHLLAPVM